MQIDGGRRRGSVAQKQLNMVEARSRFNQVGGKLCLKVWTLTGLVMPARFFAA